MSVKALPDGVYIGLGEERWLPVLGFEGLYEVSDHGRVRSVARVLRSIRRLPDGREVVVNRRYDEKILAPGTVKSGHQIVILGRGNPRLVHRLVLDAFVGPRPDGKECCHGDGDPANNHLDNLRWDTRSENVRDAIRHGTYRGGSQPGRSPRAKLRAEQIPAIRREIARGRRNADIAAEYGVGRSAIYLVATGRNWSHVPGVAS